MLSRSRPARRAAGAAAALLAAGLAACGGRAAAGPAPAPERAPPLPPVPLVTGPLNVRVQYPRPDQAIQARDSNFILGSVGNGRATLTINGTPVRVLPNGAFLGWLPVPPESRYELVAVLGADSARLVLPVRTPGSRAAAEGTPPAVAALPPADSGAQRAPGDSARSPGLAAARAAAPAGGSAPAPPAARYAVLTAPLDATGPAPGDSDAVVIARPVPGGTYKWFLFPGTVLPVTGAQGASRRVQLDERLAVWVDSALVRDDPSRGIPGAAPLPRRVASNPRVVPSAEWAEVVIPIGDRPPFLVEEQGTTIVLTLYGTRANTDIIQYLANDTLVRNITWTQESDDRARYVIQLSRAPYGYLALWRGQSFVLRIRRPPAVNAARPLAGLTIAVDPGHPPIGATGPTGLYEAVAVLAVGKQLQAMLEARGARVVMTRTTDAPVALGDRPAIARRANAHALVSIHLNALPDGINPLVVNGTGTYFFHPHAEPLARDVQRGMVRRLGLRDMGVYYDNLALARPTWMPSVLCEGAFIIVPEQEAALRTPEFQGRYAQGIAEGLEAYFRALPGR